MLACCKIVLTKSFICEDNEVLKIVDPVFPWQYKNQVVSLSIKGPLSGSEGPKMGQNDLIYDFREHFVYFHVTKVKTEYIFRGS